MLLKALRLLFSKALGRLLRGGALEKAMKGYVTKINLNHSVPEVKISDKTCQTSEMYHNAPAGGASARARYILFSGGKSKNQQKK